MLNFIVSDRGVIHMYCDGVRLTPIQPDHINYKKILNTLKSGGATIAQLNELSDVAVTIREFSSGKLSIEGGRVKYGDFVLDHTPLIQRMFDLMDEGQSFMPLVKFVENLMENPSKASVDQLYQFLDQHGLPITEDGCFLAYKAVTVDFMDKWTCEISNKVGETVSVPRNSVVDDPDQNCAAGLHCGSLKYVGWYGNGGDNIILVKVNPKDAVSVPSSEATDKLRVCEYTVVDHYGTYGDVYDGATKFLEGALYTTSGQRIEPSKLREDYKGMFDNESGDHWDNDEPEDYMDDACSGCGHTYDLCDCDGCYECEEDVNDAWY